MCAKTTDGIERRQRWVGLTMWHGQAYDRYLCDCDGTKHVNWVIRVSHREACRVIEHGCAVANGRSVFGQTLAHRPGA